jgi:microcystin-dependent protein
MTDPFVAEIRMFGFNFPPKGWAYCSGQLMPISQNTALFSLLGTMYGGDGKSTFGLPDLEGSGAVSVGRGAGSEYYQGETAGVNTVALVETEMPTHTHPAQASGDPAEYAAPAPDRALSRAAPGTPYQPTSTANLVNMDAQAITVEGSGIPHTNLPPILVLNACIALQGVFPQRP